MAAERRSGTRRRPFAVVATAGTTNLGIVDDLAGIVAIAQRHGLWTHVDGAYGGAALAAPSTRHLYDGIEQADSFVVDPHKWLFAPFDCAALLYREPEKARQPMCNTPATSSPCGPAMTGARRTMPSTSRDGREACRSGSRSPPTGHGHTPRPSRGRSRWRATPPAAVRHHPCLELVTEPMLSVVAFRRLGWGEEEYYGWSKRLLEAGQAFVVPTTHHGEVVLRIAVVNPRSSEADIDLVLDSLGTDRGARPTHGQ